MKTYDGLTNIWLNLKDLSKFPYNMDDCMAIDHLKCNKGYCLISRSVIYKNVNINMCLDLDLDKITPNNLHLFKNGHIILCKMPSWNNYVPGTIIKIHKKIIDEYVLCERTHNIMLETIDNTFDICFPSCPDSDICLVWHNGNEIKRNKTVLTYKNLLSPENNCETNFIKKTYKLKSPDAPFLVNDEDSGDEIIEDILHDIIDKIVKKNKPTSIVHSGLFDKTDTYKNEILRYKVFWLKICKDNNCLISSKPLNISHNTTSGRFLSNVSIINPGQINEIMKIQVANRCGLKIINKRLYKLVDKAHLLEPQNIKFLKKLPQQLYFFNKDFLYTYTGYLCNAAKQYLFNINKIDIK